MPAANTVLAKAGQTEVQSAVFGKIISISIGCRQTELYFPAFANTFASHTYTVERQAAKQKEGCFYCSVKFSMYK